MKRKFTLIGFAVLFHCAGLSSPLYSLQHPVQKLDIHAVQQGPTQRLYFYSTSGDENKLLSFRNKLISNGARNVNYFFPSIIACELPLGMSMSELYKDPDIVLVPEAEDFTGDVHCPVSELRWVKQCYARIQKDLLDSPTIIPAFLVQDTVYVIPKESVPRKRGRASSGYLDEYRTIQQNSEFMMGDILAQLVYPESEGNQENWSNQALANASAGVTLMMLYYQEAYKHAPIHIIFKSFPRTPTSVEPINFRKEQEAVWVTDVMSHLGFEGSQSEYLHLVHRFNNSGRQEYSTDWVFTAFIINSENAPDHNFPRAGRTMGWSYLGGPYLVIPYPPGEGSSYQFSQVFKREIAHIFWALYEDLGGGTNCKTRSGYLNYKNWNKIISVDPAGRSKSCGGGPPDPCLMISGYIYSSMPIPHCYYTTGMIGLIDENNNNVPDALDAAPIVEFESTEMETVLTDDFILKFKAISLGVPNRNQQQDPENRLNYAVPVKDVSYKVCGVGPLILLPDDGVSDETTEEFTAYLSSLIPGITNIEVVTRNTMGSISQGFLKQLYYLGLNFSHFRFEFQNRSICISWNMIGETFDATFDLHRIETYPVPCDSIIISDLQPTGPSNGLFTPLSCFDKNVVPGRTYRYYVEGTFLFLYRGEEYTVTKKSNEFEVIASLYMKEGDLISAPSPNPFRDKTLISINIPPTYREAGTGTQNIIQEKGAVGSARAPSILESIPTQVKVTVYNVLGQRVKDLYKTNIRSTVITIPWDGTNNNNQQLPSGIYFIRAEAGGFTQVQKVLIVR